MNNRRDFLRKMGAAAGALSVYPILDLVKNEGFEQKLLESADIGASTLAGDEDFWGWVKDAYTVSPNVINLNNGGVSPQPKVVQEALTRYNQLSNELPSYYMWEVLEKGRENIRLDLSRLAGCSIDEISINRNATEALNTVIFGLPLKAGDEVVLTKQDYPNMINAWKQREKRDGIKLEWVNLEMPNEDDDKMVNAFESAFTSKTKILHLTHVINWNGQILPVKKIIAAAHKRGIEVLVDGAHSFGQFEFNLKDLDCDYFGTSLHKWLCAPFGSGMLFVKKEKIKKIWPLLSAPEPESEDIRKFEHLGTRSIPIEHAIGTAIAFHDMIGFERKAARLRYLKNYWVNALTGTPGFKMQTSLKDQYSCGIAMFGIEGKKPGEVKQELFNKYSVHTVSIEWENINGVRVSPNVYTSTRDLDKFIKGVSNIAHT